MDGKVSIFTAIFENDDRWEMKILRSRGRDVAGLNLVRGEILSQSHFSMLC